VTRAALPATRFAVTLGISDDEVAGHRASRTRVTRPAGLSERQVEVLRLVAAGLSDREIALRLHVSLRTTEHHVQDIYAKIGASSRAASGHVRDGAPPHRLRSPP